MGNCGSGRASLASHSTYSSTLTLVASPGATISRDDIVFLLLGPVGAETTLFGKLVTHTKDSANESLCGPAQFSEDNVQFYETTAPGSSKRVVLVIPPSLDGEKITEEIVVKEVHEYLSRNHQNHPYIDRVLYFSETSRRHNIPLTTVLSYLSDLKALCNASDSTLYNKVSLITTASANGTNEDASKIPREWMFLQKKGAKQFIFNKTDVSALDIFGTIINGA